jgi:hypothetical protein
MKAALGAGLLVWHSADSAPLLSQTSNRRGRRDLQRSQRILADGGKKLKLSSAARPAPFDYFDLLGRSELH